jgi:PAS domain S-box-containing protein
LRAGTGLFRANRTVSAEEFRRFVAQLNLEEKYPGIQGIGFTRRISPADRAAWEASVRLVHPDFRIWPDHPRDEYHSIVYLEPLDRRNRAAIGYDMFTEPTRQAAMARARDTGQPAASGRVTLVQEIDEDKQHGFLIYTPVYKRGTTPDTLEERRRELEGFVYSPFRIGDLMEGIFGRQQHPRVHFTIYDGNPTSENLLFESLPAGSRPIYRPRFRETQALEFAGTKWTISYATRPEFEISSARNYSFFVLAAGVLTSLLLFFIVRSQERTSEKLARSRKEFEASEERFRMLVESTSVIAWEADAQTGQFTYVGPAAQTIMGYPLKEWYGPTFWPDHIHPEDREWTVNYCVESSRSKRDYDFEYRMIAADGRVVWLRDIVNVVTLQGRSMLRGFMIDITARKTAEAEIHKLNQELERKVAERTAELVASNRELEAFCYSVSHDLRAPLRSIDGFSRLLLESSGGKLDPESEQHLGRIRAAAQQMAQIINSLLMMSRLSRSELRRETVDLSAHATEIAAELRKSHPGAATRIFVEPGLTAKGDPAMLKVVLQNLLDNAWKFTSKTADARIELGRGEADGSPVFFVRDNGAGFDMAYANKLFGAFERLHSQEDFPGTGIGLATAQRIIHRHGGKIWAQSAPAKGAVFYFTLPEADASDSLSATEVSRPASRPA